MLLPFEKAKGVLTDWVLIGHGRGCSCCGIASSCKAEAAEALCFDGLLVHHSDSNPYLTPFRDIHVMESMLGTLVNSPFDGRELVLLES